MKHARGQHKWIQSKVKHDVEVLLQHHEKYEIDALLIYCVDP